MCGYDPLEWYEKELDNQYLAQQAGFDSYEEYCEFLEDKKHDDFDSYDER